MDSKQLVRDKHHFNENEVNLILTLLELYGLSEDFVKGLKKSEFSEAEIGFCLGVFATVEAHSEKMRWNGLMES